MATTLDRMKSVICDYTDLKPSDITEETNIRTDLSLNYLELVNLAVAIEDEFDVEIPDREALGLETVADAIAIIEKYSE